VILDTTVLIDLEREVRRQTPGRAANAIERYAGTTFGVSAVAAAELSEGYEDAGRRASLQFLTHFEFLPVDDETGWIWSRLSRQARSEGRSLGDNDLWIAATAARHVRPLLTRNPRDFAGLPGVVVVTY
jgi:predicted nucleic acid-binding protein